MAARYVGARGRVAALAARPEVAGAVAGAVIGLVVLVVALGPPGLATTDAVPPLVRIPIFFGALAAVPYGVFGGALMGGGAIDLPRGRYVGLAAALALVAAVVHTLVVLLFSFAPALLAMAFAPPGTSFAAKLLELVAVSALVAGTAAAVLSIPWAWLVRALVGGASGGTGTKP